MATQERIICRLCLKMCHDFKAIELDMKDLLNVILPNIDLAAPQEPVMCSNCIEMVTECSDFRARCLYTHDYVVAFASDKGVDKVNLKDVYLSGNENGTDVPEDQDICFFCMSPVKNCSAISVVEEGSVILENIIKHCIPELDLSMIKKPVICPPCHGSLKYWYSFMMNCLIVEEKIKKYKTLDTNSEEINLNSVLQFTIRDVTAGDVDGDSADVINVKEEFSEDTKILDEKETGNGRDTVKLEQVFLGDNEDAYKGVKNKNDIFMDMEDQVLPKNMLACSDERNNLSSIKREETFCGEIETKCKEENFVEIEDQKFLLNEQIEIKPDEPYFNRIEDDIVLPQSEVTIRLQNSSKVTMYKCDFCLYQTKLKRELRSHLSKHKDPLEVTVYKCDFCSFETKSKYTLKKHLLEHKHPSEITMYKCDFCSFQTKVKCSLKRHLLRHKDPSEVTKYSCDFCSYWSIRKDNLELHLIHHKNPSEMMMYKCHYCSFQTKRKSYFKRHSLKHEALSGVTVYKCNSCSFDTKYKGSLKKHLVPNPLENTLYRCDSCSFQTKYKGCHTQHLLEHHDPPEVTIYKCDFCSFETRYRGCLTQHLMKHEHPPEIIHKCDSCSFQTKYNWYLKKHLLQHRTLQK